MRATVQVRIDEATRKQASDLFENMGLDIPTAIRMFLKQSIESNGLPFQPTSTKDTNGLSLYDSTRVERAEKQLEVNGGGVRELIENITREQIQARQALKQVFKQMQEESVKNGTDKMTMEEIDEEIAAYRREKRKQLC